MSRANERPALPAVDETHFGWLTRPPAFENLSYNLPEYLFSARSCEFQPVSERCHPHAERKYATSPFTETQYPFNCEPLLWGSYGIHLAIPIGEGDSMDYTFSSGRATRANR